MFEIGEVVFCPKRGSGVVEAIEERTMLNESKEYMIIQMKTPQITMMIATDKLDTSCFRKISNNEEVDKLEALLHGTEVDIDYSIDAKKRTKLNQDKLTEGSFVACGEVVRDLSRMEKIKPLNNAEKNLLMQAKHLLADEYAVVKQMGTDEAKVAIGNLLEEA